MEVASLSVSSSIYSRSSPLMNNHSSLYSHPSSRSSDSTQGTSATTLFAPTPTPSHGSYIEASKNVLNMQGDKEKSLFQICLNLRRRLEGVRGFGQWLIDEERADNDLDPVTLLWRVFRRGFPLVDLYNALRPDNPLQPPDEKLRPEKRTQIATYTFIKALMKEFEISTEECFTLTDLNNNDTAGFVKVARVINRILDQTGVSSYPTHSANGAEAPATGKRTQREHIIDELVRTERTYVQHLDLLQQFKKLVEERSVISGDAIHDIFLNLNSLLDFQRRFLIRVEQINAQPEDEQNWGKLVVLYSDAFKVYEPYIGNQKKCEEVAMREFDKLKETGGSPEMQQIVESPTHLTSILLKPFQRLTKYPLLLKELQNKGGLDEERKSDIATGIEAANSVLHRTNAAVDREERTKAVEELKQRVEDWKGHILDGFGELLLHGTFTVLKSDSSSSKDPEREYKIYLFELILLCCKEMNPNKPKNKIKGSNILDKRGKPKLQLKGRIFMQNVTETISLSKPGSYTCQIFWKGDPGIENFIIRFSSEEVMKKWAAQVDMQRRSRQEQVRVTLPSTGTSATEFTFLKNEQLENPYAENDADDDDDETVVSGPPQSDYSLPRTESFSSIRSRSTTGDSGGDPRIPASRYPPGYGGTQPLTVRTQQLHGQAHGPTSGSPGGYGGVAPDSYFSPSVDTPISSRTSSSSTGMFPFPRQNTANGWHVEEHNSRFTAPASTRRDTQMGRNNAGQRPSLPPNTGSQYGATAQNRLRSASSPDIQNSGGRRVQSTQPPPPVPDMPPFPTHYAYNPALVINRSQSNSPSASAVPARTGTQSPNIQRERIRMTQEGPPAFDPRHPGYSRTMTPTSVDRTMTPSSIDSRGISPPLPPPTPQLDDMPIPSQLKVKVHCPSAGTTMTLVVSTNISFQSLKDRIEAKLQRSTNVSLSSGQVKLKYLDDDDFVSIQSDEDVQTAFETWREQQREQIMSGALGEIELYCQR